MTTFNYTTDIPTDPTEFTNGFYRLPRSILLPPYLSNNPYFTEYADAIDQVFDGTVETPLYALQNIRNTWTATKGTEAVITSGKMIDVTEWGGVDHGTVVSQVNLLGLQLSTAEIVSEVSYRTLSRFLGSYWYSKGKQSAVDFMNFCLGTNIVMTSLWTQDYVNFVPYPGDSSLLIEDVTLTPQDFNPAPHHSVVGGWKVDGYTSTINQPLCQNTITAVDNLKPWFPTTHVTLSLPYTTTLSPVTVGQLFYEVCNYNLVLHNVDLKYVIPATPQAIVCAGMTTHNVFSLSNV